MNRLLKKIIVTGLALCTLLLCVQPVCAASAPIVMSVENCKNCVTLREKPDGKSAEITKIPLKAEVTVVSTAYKGFYMVDYMGDVGYVLTKYLGYAYSMPSADDIDRDYHSANNPRVVVDCKEFITLRDSDNGKGEEIIKIPLGAIVDYLDSDSKGYAEVSYRGITGYVQSKYLKPVDDMDIPESVTLSVVNCKKSITLRNTPNINGKEIIQIPLGAEVDFLGYAENGFYKVSYKGNTGYALSRYLG